MKTQSYRRWILVLLVLTTVLAAGSVYVVGAQAGTPIPIEVGQNMTGEAVAGEPGPLYGINVTAPQSINIQVIALTPGFVPALTVWDPAGIEVQAATNDTNQSLLQAAPLLASPGVYRVEVRDKNGGAGQFVLSVQPGGPLAPPQLLSAGQVLTGTLSSAQGRQSYLFNGSPSDTLRVEVETAGANVGAVVTLRDAMSGEPLGVSSARLAGVRYRIPLGTGNYLVEVARLGEAASVPFTICLESENGPPACPSSALAAVPTPTLALLPTIAIPTLAPVIATPIPIVVPTATVPPPTPLPPLPSFGPCIVASATGAQVNVRSGPSTDFPVVTRISGMITLPVIGRLPDFSWYMVSVSGLTSWISGSVVRLGGECALVLPVTVTPPVLPPTFTPTATWTTTGPTATWTSTPSATPTNTDVPPAAATLNFSLPPNYGSTALTSGFVPDPFTVGVTAGGSANVTYLGGGCTGYATSAPDFSVNYTSGAFPTLRFYFVGSGDSTMIINSPSGSYFCVDDSFGTLNPTIDFNSPSSGRYDIWIGSYAEGSFISGTLYVTESTANHP